MWISVINMIDNFELAKQHFIIMYKKKNMTKMKFGA